MVLILPMGLLAACGSDDTTTTEDANSAQTDSATDESGETNAEDVIGEISDISSTYMSLDVYEPAAEVSDYASLDVSTLTATDGTARVALDADAEYYYISDFSMVSLAAENLSAGDLVAVTTTEDGVQQVILLEKGSGDSAGARSEAYAGDAAA